MFVVLKRSPDGSDDGTTISPSTAEIVLEGQSRRERRYGLKTLNESVRRIGVKQSRVVRPGAGYPIDRTLRSLISNLNRFARVYQTPDVLPPGWHTYQPFTELLNIGEGVPATVPKPETDHLFEMEDFLAWTSSGEGSGPLGVDAGMREGLVLNYTLAGDAMPFVFDDGVGGTIGLSGFSMVRHGDDVNWIMVGGYVFDEEEWDLAVSRGSAPVHEALGEVGTQSDDGSRRIVRGRPVPFEGARAQKVVFLGAYDLGRACHVKRCRMVEWEHLYDLVADDPTDFDCDEDSVALMGNRQERTMEGLEPVWSMAETMLRLPAYFDFRISYVVHTAVSGGRALPVRPSEGNAKDGRPENPFRMVRSLAPVRIGQASVWTEREHVAPTHRVEVSGYWRILASDSIGKGPAGESVVGRTWVRSYDRYRDKPEKPNRVLVKASVSAAWSKAAELGVAPEVVEGE